MTRPLTAALLAFAVALAACGGRYTEASTPSSKGFSSEPVTANEWLVRFNGDFAMTARHAENLALRRAAEIADLRGYDWIEISERRTLMKTTLVSAVRPRSLIGPRSGSRLAREDFDEARIETDAAAAASDDETPAALESAPAASAADLNARALADFDAKISKRASAARLGDTTAEENRAEPLDEGAVGRPQSELRVVFGVREPPSAGEVYDVDALLRALAEL